MPCQCISCIFERSSWATMLNLLDI
jgi:hypothetical protein